MVRLRLLPALCDDLARHLLPDLVVFLLVVYDHILSLAGILLDTLPVLIPLFLVTLGGLFLHVVVLEGVLLVLDTAIGSTVADPTLGRLTLTLAGTLAVLTLLAVFTDAVVVVVLVQETVCVVHLVGEDALVLVLPLGEGGVFVLQQHVLVLHLDVLEGQFDLPHVFEQA